MCSLMRQYADQIFQMPDFKVKVSAGYQRSSHSPLPCPLHFLWTLCASLRHQAKQSLLTPGLKVKVAASCKGSYTVFFSVVHSVSSWTLGLILKVLHTILLTLMRPPVESELQITAFWWMVLKIFQSFVHMVIRVCGECHFQTLCSKVNVTTWFKRHTFT